jgi:hypothetical protein
MRAPSARFIAFGLVLAGCGSTAGGTSSSEPAAESVSLLTSTEYTAAVGDLLGVQYALGAGPALAGSTPTASSSPSVALGYRNAAVDIARTATLPANLPALLARVNAGCSTPAGDDGAAGSACAMSFIQQLTPLAFHAASAEGASSAATVGGLIDVYAAVSPTQAFSGGIAAVLQEVLQSPYFLYHLPAR